MKTRFPALVALAVAAVTAAPAHAAAPVTVRVEGDADTLVARTALTTTPTPVVKDGDPAHACTGTSAAGALEQATGGAWGGSWFDGLGLSVDVIRGESHVFGSGAFWSVFVDNAPASAGLCGLELSSGAELLLAPEPESGAQRNPLVLQGVPTTAAPGRPVTVKVVRYVTTFGPAPDFTPSTAVEPVAGAAITGSAGATTGADGTAQVTFASTGPGALKAGKAGEIRSAAEPVCVTAGGDGTCGTTGPGAGAGPRPGAARDRIAPRARITSIRDGARFAHGKGPRTLAGRVAPDPSGIAHLRLRLKRNRGGVCSGWDARRERLVRIPRCGTHRFGRWFSVGTNARWSYLLPARLGRGRYVLDVQARDRAGNATLLHRGRTRVIFRVA